MAHGLYKDAELRDNPPLDTPQPAGRRLRSAASVYNANRPETHGVYRDWRKIAESYSPPRLLLGETWTGDRAGWPSTTATTTSCSSAFNFPFSFAPGSRPSWPRRGGHAGRAAAGACPVWMASNHDLGRFPTRWCGGDERKIRLALLMLATLPGTAVLYYGDEIGMTDVDVPLELRRDNATLDVARAPTGTGPARPCRGTAPPAAVSAVRMWPRGCRWASTRG